jgi:hypothetical protein
LIAFAWTAAACSHEAPAPAPDGYVPTRQADLPNDAQAETPRRLRRLTNREIENVLADLLGARLDLTKGFLRDPDHDGYDNDAAALQVTASKVDEMAAAAERAGVYVSAPERLAQFAPCGAGEPAPACARRFATTLATRAWGRPPERDELDRLDRVFGAGVEGADYASGVALVAEAVLQSPHFLYRTELGDGPPVEGRVRLTPYEIASAISFSITGSRPDPALLASAAAGELGNPSARDREARRLLATPPARRQLRGFLRAWLRLTDVAMINKDLGVYPVFTPKVRFAMDRELDTFLDAVLDGSGKLDELVLADYSFPGPDLAPIYQGDLLDPPGDFTRVRLDPHHRRGVLSSPAFLATHALVDQTNPVERGLMIRGSVLCQEVSPPPPGVVAVTPPGGAGVTTRAKYAAHSSNGFCHACHQLMDPIGFGFESFDTLGRFRTMDNGQPVDSSGELIGTDIDGPFNGPAELSERLPRSAIFRRCFVRQLWRFAEGRAAEGKDDPEIDGLAWRFEQAEHRIGELLVALVARPTFVWRKVEGTP